jgi:hypothetical protein
MSLFDTVSQQVTSSSLLGSMFGALGDSLINSAVSQFVPNEVTNQLDNISRIGGDVVSGDYLGAGRHLLNTGIADNVLGDFSGMAKQALFWATPTPMFGGLSPADAKALHKQSMGLAFARKNRFLIEVGSFLSGDVSQRFNLMTSEISYSSATLTGDYKKAGAASVDSVQASEPVELSITVYDDANGTLKNWFNNHAKAVAAIDGTLGLPFYYAIRIKVVHSFVQSTFGAYEDLGLFRPQNMELSLSRREDALQELTMTFKQLDTFMRP